MVFVLDTPDKAHFPKLRRSKSFLGGLTVGSASDNNRHTDCAGARAQLGFHEHTLFLLSTNINLLQSWL